MNHGVDETGNVNCYYDDDLADLALLPSSACTSGDPDPVLSVGSAGFHTPLLSIVGYRG